MFAYIYSVCIKNQAGLMISTQIIWAKHNNRQGHIKVTNRYRRKHCENTDEKDLRQNKQAKNNENTASTSAIFCYNYNVNIAAFWETSITPIAASGNASHTFGKKKSVFYNCPKTFQFKKCFESDR